MGRGIDGINVNNLLGRSTGRFGQFLGRPDCPVFCFCHILLCGSFSFRRGLFGGRLFCCHGFLCGWGLFRYGIFGASLVLHDMLVLGGRLHFGQGILCGCTRLSCDNLLGGHLTSVRHIHQVHPGLEVMLLWRFAMALSCRASVGGTSGYHLTSFFVLQVSYLLLFSLSLCNVVFQWLYPAPKAIHVLLVLNGAVLCFFALMIC
jgi:hypothetical protein